MALCFIEPELLPMEVLHCGNRIFFYLFGSRDLDLEPMAFICEFERIPRRYTGYANINILRQGFRKLSYNSETDRQTDRQTDTTVIVYHGTPLRCWSAVARVKRRQSPASKRTMPQQYRQGNVRKVQSV